jgi:hypothetical protein
MITVRDLLFILVFMLAFASLVVIVILCQIWEEVRQLAAMTQATTRAPACPVEQPEVATISAWRSRGRRSPRDRRER